MENVSSGNILKCSYKHPALISVLQARDHASSVIQLLFCCDLAATAYVAASIWRKSPFLAGNWEAETAITDHATRYAEHTGSILQQSSVLQNDFHAVLVHTSYTAVLRDDSSGVAPPACLHHICSCHSTPLGMWTWSRLPPDHLAPAAQL